MLSLSYGLTTSSPPSAHSVLTPSRNGTCFLCDSVDMEQVFLTVCSVERALEQDKTPLTTLLFLENLEAKASGDDCAPYAFAKEWAPEWRLKIVSAIKNPNTYEAETILDASMKAGGAKILEKT